MKVRLAPIGKENDGISPTDLKPLQVIEIRKNTATPKLIFNNTRSSSIKLGSAPDPTF